MTLLKNYSRQQTGLTKYDDETTLQKRYKVLVL